MLAPPPPRRPAAPRRWGEVNTQNTHPVCGPVLGGQVTGDDHITLLRARSGGPEFKSPRPDRFVSMQLTRHAAGLLFRLPPRSPLSWRSIPISACLSRSLTIFQGMRAGLRDDPHSVPPAASRTQSLIEPRHRLPTGSQGRRDLVRIDVARPSHSAQ